MSGWLERGASPTVKNDSSVGRRALLKVTHMGFRLGAKRRLLRPSPVGQEANAREALEPPWPFCAVNFVSIVRTTCRYTVECADC